MTPLQLLRLVEPVEQMYMNCQSQLIINIASHFKSGKGLETRDWEIQKLAEIGALQDETIEIIAANTGQKASELRQVFDKVVSDAAKDAEKILGGAVAKGVIETSASSTVASQRVLTVLTNYTNQAKDATNLVNTVMLKSTLQRYRWAVNGVVNYEEAEQIKRLMHVTDEIGLKGQLKAAQQILNDTTGSLLLGAETRQQAISRAIKQLADKGIAGFVDIAGHEWSPEAYVDMDIRTTAHNASIEAQKARSADCGVYTFQISVHGGARPRCAPYQGKVYSWDGSSGVIHDLYGNAYPYESIKNTSYGEAAGIFGINCGHNPITFVDNYSVPRYEPLTDAELKQNDVEYEKTQVQRKLERDIRKNKTEALAQQAAGNPEAFDKAALKVKQSQATYKAYCKENNLTERGYRTQVSGYNRSVASKATASVQSSMMTRRKVADDGHEIIDQPTYNKLTRKFIKSGGTIYRDAKTDAFLDMQHAQAAYISSEKLALFRTDATVSDVLEEMIHAEQDRTNAYGLVSSTDDKVSIKREIAAKKQLLRLKDKYKIPAAEIQETEKSLAIYEQRLKDMVSDVSRKR